MENFIFILYNRQICAMPYRITIIIFYPLYIPVRTHATIGLSRSGRKRCT